MQYSWVLEFPNSNVCSTIGPGNFLIKFFSSANRLSISFKHLTWSIYVYFIYYQPKPHLTVNCWTRCTVPGSCWCTPRGSSSRTSWPSSPTTTASRDSSSARSFRITTSYPVYSALYRTGSGNGDRLNLKNCLFKTGSNLRNCLFKTGSDQIKETVCLWPDQIKSKKLSL